MIGSIRGTVIDREPAFDKGNNEILVETGGVGYRIVVTPATMASVSLDAEMFLYIHHHHWEADQKLFGFPTRDERNAFEGLLGAHKVGPGLALAILATYPPAELARVLANDDLDSLCEVPGVGKKTAQRLLVDLKSTLVLPTLDTAEGDPIDLTDSGLRSAVLSDVRDALEALGYGSDDIRSAVGALDPADIDAAGADLAKSGSGPLLKKALRALAAGA